MTGTLDVGRYRERAEQLVRALDREYYEHYAGLKESYDIAAIHEAFADLFTPAAVHELRELAGDLDTARDADRWLLLFAVRGRLSRASNAEQAEIARREARLALELDGTKIPFRQSSSVQANERDADRRLAIEAKRLEVVEQDLNALYEDILERSHELVAELGWPSYAAMFAELRRLDLDGLAGEARRFLDATDGSLATVIEPALKAQLGSGYGDTGRADLPHFFRAATLDASYPADRSLACFAETLTGLGIRLAEQTNIIVDIGSRPRKSPRAFCAHPQIPDEIYLVTAPIGGRDDYSMLLHEGGHAEHYAHVDRALGFEAKYLGDSSVTEGFAFLFDHLADSGAWLDVFLDAPAGELEAIESHARAARLLLVRRYAAKLLYELDLHGRGNSRSERSARYAELLSRAAGVAWPGETYLSDVDEGFYVASYLRAWGVEASLRKHLRAHHGESWFAERQAGDLLKSMWRRGQSLAAEELLDAIGAEPLGLELVRDELV